MHITYEEIQPSTYENQAVEKVDNFQRNARFQNETNFSPREAYLPMKIFCKFGEPSWCSFALTALVSKISLRAAAAVAYRKLSQSIHRMPPSNTIIHGIVYVYFYQVIRW